MSNAYALDATGSTFALAACSKTYGYDAQGRVTSISATVDGVTRVKTYTYNAAGDVATETPWVVQ
ncbi:hypothetical protein [Asticcacaulis excentricus]|uniref:hypothetical protein n=1 Tax=Asticcacaulis excentricus TaxID=78587 RepID=UPI0001A7633D|nr:hypothetical protein [Asticcacaulis excentricus]